MPKVYANGFQIGISNADMHVILTLAGRPIQVMFLSYTLAKTLHEKLGGVVQEFETQVDRKMLTTDDIHEAFQGGEK